MAPIAIFAGFLAACGWAYLRASRPKYLLSDEQAAVVRALPERRRNQHLVDVTLTDGREIKGLYIAYCRHLVPGLLPHRRFASGRVLEIRGHTKY